jgi:hypothetical protein
VNYFTLGGGFRAAISRKRAANPRSDVRFGSLADICDAKGHVRFTPNSDRESGFPHKIISALPPKADMCGATSNVRFGPIADIGLIIPGEKRRWA